MTNKIYSIEFNQKHDTITIKATLTSKAELKRFISDLKALTVGFVGVK